MPAYPLLLFCFYISLAPGHLGFSPACCYPVIVPTESDIQFGFSYFNLGNRSVLHNFYTSPLAFSVLTALENYPHCDIFCPDDIPSEPVSVWRVGGWRVHILFLIICYYSITVQR